MIKWYIRAVPHTAGDISNKKAYGVSHTLFLTDKRKTIDQFFFFHAPRVNRSIPSRIAVGWGGQPGM